MNNNPLYEQGGDRIWDTGITTWRLEELVHYLIIIGIMILIAKVFL